MTLSKLLYTCLKHRWERAVAVAAFAVGAIALLVGWLGISKATLTTEQLPYLASGGLVGLFALGLAATFWLSADMRDEFHTLLHIRHLLEEGSDESDRLGTEVTLPGNGVVAPGPAGVPSLTARSLGAK